MIKSSLVRMLMLIFGVIGIMLVAWVWTDRTFYEVVVEDTIDAPIEEAWKILATDYGKISRYSEFVDAVVIEGDEIGLGCIRKCTLKDGGYMKEEITQWEPPWRLEIVIRDSSMPMVPGTSVLFELTQQGDQVHIKATGKYRLKFLGPLSPLVAEARYLDLVSHLIEIVKNQA